MTLIDFSFLGIIGYLLKYVTPLTIVPTVSLVGLSLFENAADAASKHWGIAVGYVYTCTINPAFFIHTTN